MQRMPTTPRRVGLTTRRSLVDRIAGGLLLMLASVAHAGNGGKPWQSPVESASPAAGSSLVELPPVLKALGVVENFEAYTIGPLAGQGGWGHSVGDTGAQVIASGISSKSARLPGLASNVFSALTRPIAVPEFGLITADVQLTGNANFFSVFSCGPFFSGTCRLHSTFEKVPGSSSVGVRANDSRGNWLSYPVAQAWVPGQTHEVGFWVRGDGSVIAYFDGRPVLYFLDPNIPRFGSTQPLANVGLRSGNQGTGAIDGSGDTLTVDNIDDQLRVLADPPGAADQLLMASFGTIQPGAAIDPRAMVELGRQVDATAFVFNGGPGIAQASRFRLAFPESIAVTADTCMGSDSVLDGVREWLSSSADVAAGQTRTCSVGLTPSATGRLVIQASALATAEDPATTSNSRSLTLDVLTPLPGQRCSGQAGSPLCPATIPDSGAGSPLVSTLQVADCGSVLDVDVGVHLQHPFADELQLVLRSPGGREVTLASNVCRADGLFDVVLDDAATAALGSQCPARGRFQASTGATALAAFNGAAGSGTWQLRIADIGAGDIGTLADWSLVLSCSDRLFGNGFEPVTPP